MIYNILLIALTVIWYLFMVVCLFSGLWACVGNEEDGWFGIYEHTLWGAIKWWWRNPFHNLFWHVLRWPNGPIYRWGKKPGWNGYIGWRPPHGAFGGAFRDEKN